MYTNQKIGTETMLTIIFVMFYGICTYAQTNYYPLIKGSGTGESSLNDFTYSHHTNYSMRIKNITVKWGLTTLFGEPVVDGVFKWKASSDTPEDYLDYRDYVLIQCMPEKSVGYSVYIKLTPTVPKSDEGYGFNTPGSPSWEKVFCTRKGEDMTREVPGFSAATAKSIWKNGFRVTGVVLLREGGKDGVLQPKSSNTDDFWNTPENTTTTQQQAQSMKQQEAISRQKQLSEQAKAKYNALKSPYSWNVNNLDTITEANIQFIKNLNPYFNNGTITLSSVSKAKVTGTANDISTNLPLAEGWNTLRIGLKGNNYNLKDSVRVYYKKAPKDNRFGTFTDSRDGNVYKWVKIGNQVWMAENHRYRVSSGCWAYDNDENNVKIYGYLYNWETAMNVCPQGWHLPSKAEWEVLAKALGGEDIAGAVMKNTNDEYKDVSGTNNRGFNALLGGFRNSNGFYHLTSEGSWWCSTKSSISSVYKISLYNSHYDNLHTKVSFYITSYLDETGISVRYLKD